MRSTKPTNSVTSAEEMHLPIPIDVGITKQPFFHDKASSIDDTGVYGPATQVHITGFDTITRIFDTKYYPSDQKLRVLEPFLSKHRLRVCYRDGKDYAERKVQEKYVDGVGDGSRKKEGMKTEWREQIELVDGGEGVRGVSSTQARKASVEGNWDRVSEMVGEGVAEWIKEQRLYSQEADAEKSYH